MRMIVFLYGMASYLLTFATVFYSMGFVGNVIVPKTIDSGEPISAIRAIITDGLLLALFAIQHSVMARPGFKRLWTRIIPEPAERSTYNVLTSVLLLLLIWQWRPMTETVWNIEDGAGRLLMTALYWAGWVLVMGSTFFLNHLDFFGLRQVYLYLRGREYTPLQFKTPAVYRLVRHPIMLGFVITFWSAPQMTAGHLFFAVATTAYILVGIRFEERDLAHLHGSTYEEYRRRVPMILPVGKSKGATAAE